MRQQSFRQRAQRRRPARTAAARPGRVPISAFAGSTARHYRLLFENAPDGYLATDLAGTIREANRAAATLVRLPLAELIGRPLASFVCGEQRERFRARLRRARPPSGQTREFTVRLLPHEADPFEASLTVSCVAEEREGIGLLWSLRDVTRRKRVEERLKQSEMRHRLLYAETLRNRDALRTLSTRYLYAREEEARRIAHELHDEAGQITAAIHLALAEVEAELLPSGREQLRHIGSLIEGVESRLRQLSHELRPTVLDDLGLTPALAFLARGFAARTQVAATVKGSTGGRLDPLVETALYRIVQEALANVGKHARSTCAEISLSREDGNLVCSIRDDGIGFDDRFVGRGVGRAAGLGLLGIRERVGALNGKMQIHSNPGEGTELRVSVPLRPR